MVEMIEETREAAAVREEARAWLADNFKPDRLISDWMEAVYDAGYAAPTFPREYGGRGLDKFGARAVAEEFGKVGAFPTNQDTNIFPATILTHGSEDMKQKWIRPFLTGRYKTCLFYSEPGAGSDLAGVTTKAERHGDEWLINGQKVWTSGAHVAEWGVLVARTDWDVPKHQGITLFLINVQQPGIDIRPLRQITNAAGFNEVFFNDARIPHENVIGEVNQGWKVLMTALGFERATLGGALSAENMGATFLGGRPGGDSPTATIRDAQQERSRMVQEVQNRRRAMADMDTIQLAQRTGKNNDPRIRQQVAYVYSIRKVNEWTNKRAMENMKVGRMGSEASLGKLAMSRIQHTTARVNAQILGAETMLADEASPRAHANNMASFSAFVTSIGGGTDQIQRNIIGERILGLPKEPEVDRSIPFRDVPKSAPRRLSGPA
jgi:alkylation response protein AidB-like acyl-CoA dehydrogenase